MGLLVPVKGHCNATAKKKLILYYFAQQFGEKLHMDMMGRGAQTFGQ